MHLCLDSFTLLWEDTSVSHLPPFYSFFALNIYTYSNLSQLSNDDHNDDNDNYANGGNSNDNVKTLPSPSIISLIILPPLPRQAFFLWVVYIHGSINSCPWITVFLCTFIFHALLLHLSLQKSFFLKFFFFLWLPK